MSSETSIILKGWLDAAATIAPGVEGLPDLLSAGLGNLEDQGLIDEAHLLGLVDEAAGYALDAGVGDASDKLVQRLRRSVYEYLLALDAVHDEINRAPLPPPRTPAPDESRPAGYVLPITDRGSFLIGAEEVEALARAHGDDDTESPLGVEVGVGGIVREGNNPAQRDTTGMRGLMARTAATPEAPADQMSPGAPAPESTPGGDGRPWGPATARADDDDRWTPTHQTMGIAGDDPGSGAPGEPRSGGAAAVEPAEDPVTDDTPGDETLEAPSKRRFGLFRRTGRSDAEPDSDLSAEEANAAGETDQRPAAAGEAAASAAAGPAAFAGDGESSQTAAETTPRVHGADERAPGSSTPGWGVRASGAGAPSSPRGAVYENVEPAQAEQQEHGAGEAFAIAPRHGFHLGDPGVVDVEAEEPAESNPFFVQTGVALDATDIAVADTGVDLTQARRAVDEKLRKKKCDEAGALLQQLAQDVGGREVAEMALDAGDRCRDLSRRQAATNCYLAASRADPVYEIPWARLADICIDDEDIDLAVSYLERVARLNRLRGDLRGALRVYRKIVSIAPHREDILEMLMRAQASEHIEG